MKSTNKRILIMLTAINLIWSFSCRNSTKEQINQQSIDTPVVADHYEHDVTFLRDYVDVIELKESSNNSKVAISASLQGRVMTSTTAKTGASYGWINHEHFLSGDTLAHINVYGGEERFWLGPEGGQYSIFFQEGSTFELDNWFTPELIDIEPFETKSINKKKAVFTKSASLVNYSGFQFEFGIERSVEILSTSKMEQILGIEIPQTLQSVGYRTSNSLTNTGDISWKKETGLLSIWLLGMFNPSPETTVLLPFKPSSDSEKAINIYESFGSIPMNRLRIEDQIAYFKGDGQKRGKIGIPHTNAKDIIGSYDSANKVLTLIKFNLPSENQAYVNSAWEIQDKPFKGDVVNSYNDGKPEPNAEPLGPFYELETSSPALALAPGDSGIHVQTTCHFQGTTQDLNTLTQKLFGVSIAEIRDVFN